VVKPKMIDTVISNFIYEYANVIAFFLVYAVMFVLFKTYFQDLEDRVVQIISATLALFSFFIP